MTVHPAIQIRPFDRDASAVEFEALNRHNNRIRQEHLPDDPPLPVEETRQNIQSLPDFVDLRMWVAWDATHTEIIALGYVSFIRMDTNRHLAQFDGSVLPEYRRQGLGRSLLARIAEATQADNRRTLMTSTVDRMPGGEAFMRRIGAKKGLEAHTNQLRIADLDRQLLDDWLRRGENNRAEFELGFWDGAYPEEQLPAIAELWEVANQQPYGELEIEDVHMTPDQLRQMEHNMFARGTQRWTYYLVDRATGKFAGYSETEWNPNRPEILRQEMTGVFPQYRQKGLGRWLKAAMLKKILQERPQVKLIRTGNADSNAAMLKINNELGFKPYKADALWQVELPVVLEYLHSHAA